MSWDFSIISRFVLLMRAISAFSKSFFFNWINKSTFVNKLFNQMIWFCLLLIFVSDINFNTTIWILQKFRFSIQKWFKSTNSSFWSFFLIKHSVQNVIEIEQNSHFKIFEFRLFWYVNHFSRSIHKTLNSFVNDQMHIRFSIFFKSNTQSLIQRFQFFKYVESILYNVFRK